MCSFNEFHCYVKILLYKQKSGWKCAQDDCKGKLKLGRLISMVCSDPCAVLA